MTHDVRHMMPDTETIESTTKVNATTHLREEAEVLDPERSLYAALIAKFSAKFSIANAGYEYYA